MYGKTEVNGTDVRQLRNEGVWTNLIMCANNKLIMDNLDVVAQKNLINLICSYVEANVEAMQKIDTMENSAILKHLKK